MPYGNQALFFRSVDFYKQHGFKQMSIMEDYELVARNPQDRKHWPCERTCDDVRSSLVKKRHIANDTC